MITGIFWPTLVKGETLQPVFVLNVYRNNTLFIRKTVRSDKSILGTTNDRSVPAKYSARFTFFSYDDTQRETFQFSQRLLNLIKEKLNGNMDEFALGGTMVDAEKLMDYVLDHPTFKKQIFEDYPCVIGINNHFVHCDTKFVLSDKNELWSMQCPNGYMFGCSENYSMSTMLYLFRMLYSEKLEQLDNCTSLNFTEKKMRMHAIFRECYDKIFYQMNEHFDSDANDMHKFMIHEYDEPNLLVEGSTAQMTFRIQKL